jgi:hypothetical protein
MRLLERAWGLAFVCVLGGCATITVEKVTSAGSNGLLYALPNTVLRIQLKVNRTTRTGAPYAAYAAIFAPDSKPVCADALCSQAPKASYEVASGVTFNTYGEPDPSNVYLVKFTGAGAIDQSLSMTWNEAGLLSAVSSTVTNRTVDIATSGVKLLAGVGSKIAFGGPTARTGKALQCSEKSSADEWMLPHLQSDSALADSYCSLSVKTREALPRDGTVLEAAFKAYESKLAPLERTRQDILSGKSQSVVLDQTTLLTKIESEIDQELTQLYVGKTTVQSWDGTLDVRTLAVGTPLRVLAIDSNKGICLGNAEVPPDAKPIPDEFARLSAEECAAGNEFDLALRYYPDVNAQLFSKVTDTGAGQRSFRYRIPAQTAVSLIDGKGKSFGSGVIRVAQLGKVMSLPAQRHSKALSYDLAFIEATGALKSFKLGTTGGLESSTLDALGSVGGSLLDAQKASQKNSEELAVLTRQDQLLKLRDDICAIQKKYGISCSVEP